MYLATQYGFYNARREGDGSTYIVRSFVRQDLENLLSLLSFSHGLEIKSADPSAYYPFWMRMSVDQFMKAAEWLCKTADYESFIGRISLLGDQRSKLKSYRKLTESLRKYGTTTSPEASLDGEEMRHTAGWKSPKGVEPPPVTLSNLNAVLRFLPRLERAVSEQSGKLADVETGDYDEELTSIVRALVEELFSEGFLFRFDYQDWLDECRRIHETEGLLDRAGVLTIRKILVCHWRADYWHDEHTHWEDLAIDGHLIRILRRMEAIRDEIASRIRVE